jgi:CubicO group peptidase (beta-lactamase class C family)
MGGPNSAGLKLRIAVASVALSAIGSSALAQATTSFENKTQQLDQLFATRANAGGSFILRYSVADRSASRAYGSLDCAGRIVMPQNARFDGGSLTKLFTAAAVFKLVEQHRLKLDDRLADLFGGVPRDKRNITVSQLLQHRAGIPNFISRDGRAMPEDDWSIDDYDYEPLSRAQMLALAWKAPLRFEPGSREEYSNYGFNLLGAIVERASGLNYETYVRRAVLAPLDMRGTGYLLAPDREPVAEQCRDGRAQSNPYKSGVWNKGVSWHLIGAGGMYTTAVDLERFSAGISSGSIFRADIALRFRSIFFGPSYRCRTTSAAVGGSNGLTRSLIYMLPERRETVVMVSTHRENTYPDESAVRATLCAKADG